MPTSNDSERYRRSPRLRGYDYTLAGAYFVTICTQGRLPCFGQVADALMQLSPAGQMVQEVWAALPAHYPGIDLDAFMIMPDHIHGILVLLGLPKQLALPDAVQRFKSLTTARYRHGLAGNGWAPFPGQLWQRSYYDHVIQNEADLERIRSYIIENPVRYWQKKSA